MTSVGWTRGGVIWTCSGGGASCGIEEALQRPVNIAINHDKVAIGMHAKNHPLTDHHCEDVWQVNPREVTKGRPVLLAWFSPDCKHHSKARGQGLPRPGSENGGHHFAAAKASVP